MRDTHGRYTGQGKRGEYKREKRAARVCIRKRRGGVEEVSRALICARAQSAATACAYARMLMHYQSLRAAGGYFRGTELVRSLCVV